MPQILIGCGTNWQLCDYATSPVYGCCTSQRRILCHCHGLLRTKVPVSGVWYAVIYTKSLTSNTTVSLGCPYLWQVYNIRCLQQPATTKRCLRGVMGYALHPIEASHVTLAREFSRHDCLLTACVSLACDTNPDLRYRLVVTIGLNDRQRRVFSLAYPEWVDEQGILGQQISISRKYESDLTAVIGQVATEFKQVITHNNSILCDCPAYAYVLGAEHVELDISITNPLMRLVDDLIDTNGRVVLESALVG